MEKAFKILQVLSVIATLIAIYVYVGLVASWSDADYCRQNISPETTCRENYNLFNWF